MITLTPEQSLPIHTVKKRRVRVNRTKAQWKQLVKEYHDSGLSQSSFCKDNNLACSSFLKWRKRFDEQTNMDFIELTEPLTQIPSHKIQEEQPIPWQVELELGAGVFLRVRAT